MLRPCRTTPCIETRTPMYNNHAVAVAVIVTFYRLPSMKQYYSHISIHASKEERAPVRVYGYTYV